jgi:hypothetical protein
LLECESASVIDWTACRHLHTACLQVMLAARLPVRGPPLNAALALWLPRLLPVLASAPALAFADVPATIRQPEA